MNVPGAWLFVVPIPPAPISRENTVAPACLGSFCLMFGPLRNQRLSNVPVILPAMLRTSQWMSNYSEMQQLITTTICSCSWFHGLTTWFFWGTKMAGRSKVGSLTWLVVGAGLWQGPQWSFPHGFLGFLRAWQLVSKKESSKKKKAETASSHKAWAWKSPSVISTTFYWSQSQGQPRSKRRGNKLSISLGEQHVHAGNGRTDGAIFRESTIQQNTFYSLQSPGKCMLLFIRNIIFLLIRWSLLAADIVRSRTIEA